MAKHLNEIISLEYKATSVKKLKINNRTKKIKEIVTDKATEEKVSCPAVTTTHRYTMVSFPADLIDLIGFG